MTRPRTLSTPATPLQAHKAWLEIFGDEMLPQFGSDADWTEWVKQQRANEEEEIRKQLAGGEVSALSLPHAALSLPAALEGCRLSSSCDWLRAPHAVALVRAAGTNRAAVEQTFISAQAAVGARGQRGRCGW